MRNTNSKIWLISEWHYGEYLFKKIKKEYMISSRNIVRIYYLFVHENRVPFSRLFVRLIQFPSPSICLSYHFLPYFPEEQKNLSDPTCAM